MIVSKLYSLFPKIWVVEKQYLEMHNGPDIDVFRAFYVCHVSLTRTWVHSKTTAGICWWRLRAIRSPLSAVILTVRAELKWHTHLFQETLLLKSECVSGHDCVLTNISHASHVVTVHVCHRNVKKNAGINHIYVLYSSWCNVCCSTIMWP